MDKKYENELLHEIDELRANIRERIRVIKTLDRALKEACKRLSKVDCKAYDSKSDCSDCICNGIENCQSAKAIMNELIEKAREEE